MEEESMIIYKISHSKRVIHREQVEAPESQEK